MVTRWDNRAPSQFKSVCQVLKPIDTEQIHSSSSRKDYKEGTLQEYHPWWSYWLWCSYTSCHFWVVKEMDMSCVETMVTVYTAIASALMISILFISGAFKSIVVKDNMKEAFWSEAVANVVVLEADAFQGTDVIYQAFSSHHHDCWVGALVIDRCSIIIPCDCPEWRPRCNHGWNLIMGALLSSKQLPWLDMSTKAVIK